jgi:heme A synthase
VCLFREFPFRFGNAIAPDRHRGEVTAAFISCIYALVATAVIGTGLLDVGLSLPAAVGVVAAGLAALAVAAAVAAMLAR